MDSIAEQNPQFATRLRVVASLVGLVFVLFVGRLWVLQLTRWTTYAEDAIANRTEIVWEQASRGIICDRNGVVLAENRPVWTVHIIPADFPADQEQVDEIVARLAGILGRERSVSTADLREQISEICQGSGPEAMPLSSTGEDVSLEAVQAIEAQHYEMPGVMIKQITQRQYPLGKMASHVIGYVRPINVDLADYELVKDFCYPQSQPAASGLLNIDKLVHQSIYTPNSLFGQEGVEASYELLERSGNIVPVIPGRRGYYLYEINASGQPVREIDSRPPDPGATVYLALDTKLQRVAEQALEQAIAGTEHTAAAVMMDVQTGEILVLASKPSLDANIWAGPISPEKWERIHNDPRRPMRNTAISGEYPPGSVFKIISATAAFQTTGLQENTTFTCDGAITVGRHHQRFECWKHSGHGAVDFYKGMAQSCDVYFYRTVLDELKAGLSSDSIARYARLFGLGSPPGIDIPGEEEGHVPDREWKATVERDSWLTGDTVNMVIGQGWLTVTPLQMVVATAAVANGGKVLQPRVVRKIKWPIWLGGQAEVLKPVVVRELDVAPETLAHVRRGMRLAVTRPHGTAQAVGGLGVVVAGKTGSAQHRPDRPTHAWFVCFAPYRQPKYAVAVFVWEGGHGGTTAAPIARRILAAAFGVERGGRVSAHLPSASD